MAQQGKDLNIAYRTTSSGAYDYFGLAKKASLDRSREMLEVSSPSTGIDECYIPGKKGWKMSCGCLLSDDLTAIETLFNRSEEFDVIMVDQNANKQWSGKAFIKSYKVVANLHEMAQLTIELQGSGALTYGVHHKTLPSV